MNPPLHTRNTSWSEPSCDGSGYHQLVGIVVPASIEKPLVLMVLEFSKAAAKLCLPLLHPTPPISRLANPLAVFCEDKQKLNLSSSEKAILLIVPGPSIFNVLQTQWDLSYDFDIHR
jgi:hypothetical protein